MLLFATGALCLSQCCAIVLFKVQCQGCGTFLTEKARALKGEYDAVSAEMGSIYYKGFSEEEITKFEEYFDRTRKNLEDRQ